ncbi:MAG: two-component regulator propeller domain-containing protein [Saprospiraceae bacterium]
MHNRSFLLALFFCLLYFRPAGGQNVIFDHLTIDQGLSNNAVYAIAEDQDGFMWFGTRDGLNRYDGYEFRIFKTDPADSVSSLPSNNIQALFKHPNGDLWIGLGSGGLCILDRASQRFRVNPFAGQIFPDWTAVSIVAIFQDSKGYIWLGTSGQGIIRIEPKGKTAEYFGADTANPGRRVLSSTCFSFAEDRQSNVWMGTSEGQIHCYNRQKDAVDVIYGRSEQGFDLYSFSKSLLIRNDILWIGTEGNGLILYDLRQKKFLKKALGNTLIKDLKQTADRVLISTDGTGLYYTKNEGISFQSVKLVPTLVNTLNTNALYDIFIDSHNNIWIGSFNGGLNVHKPNKSEFLSYAEVPNSIAAPGNQSVLAFHEDKDGFIWIGKDGGGLQRFDPKDQSFITYTANPSNPNTISSNVITSVYEDSKGNLWVGTFAYGLNRFDRKKNSVEVFQHDPADSNSISNNNVWAIREDWDGKLWIATLGGGLNRFDYTNKRFYRFQPDANWPNSPNHLSDWNVRTLMVDKNNQMWIGTEFGGLNKRDPVSGTFTNWRVNSANAKGLKSNSILCLHQDHSGCLWLGTEGDGLFKMADDQQSFQQYTTKDGLPSNVINAIEADQNGLLWISTNQGLASFELPTQRINTYDQNDGLKSNQFNPGASLTTRSREIYFGGISGINAFVPNAIKSNPVPPKVVFTDFKLFNRSLPLGKFEGRTIYSGPLNEGPAVQLNYSDNVFTISFTALDFTNPARNQFAYRLVGFEEVWNLVDASRRYATYTNLDAGDYVFQVKATNNSGVWAEKVAELAICISPPFWETWWFLFLLTSMIGGLMALYIYYLDNKRKEAHQKELLKAEQEILQLKNERLSEEVEKKNDQLSAALLQSAHKNNSLDGLKKQLTGISLEFQGDAEQKKEIRQLIRKIDVELSSEDYWEQFQLNFDQVHQQFSKKLHQRHSQLSPNDIRLCCLLRINMTNKEIAAIQSVSLGSVEKSKYRLKKKLTLDKDADLNLYILDLA